MNCDQSQMEICIYLNNDLAVLNISTRNEDVYMTIVKNKKISIQKRDKLGHLKHHHSENTEYLFNWPSDFSN